METNDFYVGDYTYFSSFYITGYRLKFYMFEIKKIAVTMAMAVGND